MSGRGATRRKNTLGRLTRKRPAINESRRIRFDPSTGNIFYAANTYPSLNYSRIPIPKGSSKAIRAKWIGNYNILPYTRGRLHRNYRQGAWTRFMTRYPRMAAEQARLRGKILEHHLREEAAGRNNGQNPKVWMENSKRERLALLKQKRIDETLTHEEDVELQLLLKEQSGQ